MKKSFDMGIKETAKSYKKYLNKKRKTVDVSKIDDDTYQVQVVAWYDNENSYTSQMVRTIKFFAEI